MKIGSLNRDELKDHEKRIYDFIKDISIKYKLYLYQTEILLRLFKLK